MQRRQRDVAFEVGEHVVVDQHRPVVVRATMDDAMADRDGFEVLRLAQPGARRLHRGRNVRNLSRCERCDRSETLRRRPRARSRGRVPMPSIWPLIRRSSSARAIRREHLELDARRARIDDEDRIHAVTPPATRAVRAARIGIEHRDRAGRHARAHRIRARGEDDRHPRAEHDAGRIGLGEEGEVLGQHVAGLEVGHDQDLRAAGDLAT